MQDVKVIVPSDLDGTTIRLTQEGKVEAVINRQAIPDKAFVKGSKVLAFDPDGNLYQFGDNSDDYYHDGYLFFSGLVSDLLPDGFTRHTFTVSVFNERESPISKATVNINVKSGLAIKSFVIEDEARAEDVSWDGTSAMTITNLDAFGNVAAQIIIVSSSDEFVSATLLLEGDAVPTNNYATLNLHPKPTPPAISNTYIKECPLITAALDGQSLSQSPQIGGPSLYISDTGALFIDGMMFINMTDKETLTGSTITLDGASSVRVFLPSNYYDVRFSGVAMVKSLGSNKYRSWNFAADNYEEATVEDYTFSDGKLVFSDGTGSDKSFKSAVIFVRAGGPECKWQQYYIGTLYRDTSTLTVQEDRIGVTGLDQKYYHYDVIGAPFGDDKFKTLPTIESSINISTNLTGVRYFTSLDSTRAQELENYYMMDRTTEESSRLIIEIPRGTAVSFQIDREDILPNQQGAVSTDTEGNVVVSANAMPTDSVYVEKQSGGGGLYNQLAVRTDSVHIIIT